MKSLSLRTALVIIALPALVLVAASCGGGDSNGNDTVPAGTPTLPPGSGQVIIVEGTPTPGGTMTLPARTGDFASLCQKTTEKQFSAPKTVIDPAKSYTATISTDKGDIVVQLDPKIAPITVNSFVFLSCSGFYDGVTFHRVISNFVAQGGDPTGTGTGGPGYTIPDEFSDQPLFEKGTLGMAKTAAPNSGGSQFFICYDLNDSQKAALNGKYTAFGKVTAGMDVVDKLTPRDPSKNPTTPGDKILGITVQEQ
jgi:cyclophilin family peptidyl-prolyl cis-trans isomerase